jgi:predicted PurR-regulated permease PerM
MTIRDVETPVTQAEPIGTLPLHIDTAQANGGRIAADLPRTTLAVFFMVGLAAAALWILRPFVPAIVWATMVVVAMWPLMLKLQARLWGKRWAAVTVLTAALLLAFVIPLSLGITMIVGQTEHVGEWAQSLQNIKVPPPPAWVENVPVVGSRISAAWRDAIAAGGEPMIQKLAPYAKVVGTWLVAQVGSAGMIMLQFLLTIVIAAILFARGESAAGALLGFFRRLAGTHGENVVILAGKAIRGVALGVVLTALIQSALGGLGLYMASVPFAGLLTAVMFMLAIAQIGPGPVLIGTVVWVYWTSESAWIPTALLIWSLFVGSIDNFLRPFLIQRAGDLPLLMVFAGVVGGLISFGLVGIFLGPVVLAIVYTLLKAWIAAEPQCAQGPLVRERLVP